MKKPSCSRIGFLIIGIVASVTCRAQNGLMLTTVATLPDFSARGRQLVLGNDGMLYGVMENSGAFGLGMIFRTTLSGSLTTVVSFNGTNGAIPQSSPILAPDGYFYGATAQGTSSNYEEVYNEGYGTIYRMDTNGVLTTLFYFDRTNGVAPLGLTLGNDGSLYGTAGGGPNYNNSNGGDGVIFKISTNGDFTLLASFNGTNGVYPDCLIQASDGNFYGTTQYGGIDDSDGLGTVFRMTPDGRLTKLGLFSGTNGAFPESIMQASDGCLYGTTDEGGETNFPFTGMGDGVIFKVTTNGDFSVLAMLNETNGAIPFGLIEVSNGVFYGTAESGGEYELGTLFQVTTNGDLTNLLAFGVTPALPAGPIGPLTKASDGNYYGISGNVAAGQATWTNAVFSIRPIQAPVLQPSLQVNQLSLSWNAWAGYSYNLLYETNLSGSNWTLLSTITPQTNGITSYSDNIGPDAQRFYEVVLQLP